MLIRSASSARQLASSRAGSAIQARSRERRAPIPLLARSQSFQVLSDAAADELIRKCLPPEFAGNGGIKVAVWGEDAYGRAPILAVLATSWRIPSFQSHRFRARS